MLATRARLPVRVVFDKVPDNLRARPTLSVTLQSAQAGSIPARLSYLTPGLDADAILMTDEFRAALVGKIAAMRGLPPADRDHLADDQARDAGNFVECLVMLVTSRWEWNDLANTNSVWTITFHDDAGRSVSAMERSTIPWKVEELTALAPSVSSFTRAWRIRFPRTFSDGTPLLRPDARELSMKFAGPLGQAWFRWSIAAASAAGDAAR